MLSSIAKQSLRPSFTTFERISFFTSSDACLIKLTPTTAVENKGEGVSVRPSSSKIDGNEWEINSRDLVASNNKIHNFDLIINSAGLHADYLANKSNLKTRYTSLPFKGKYWKISLSSSEKSILFENTYRGVVEKFELKSEDLNYHEVLEINNLSEHSKIFQENVKLVFENEKLVINSSLHLVDLILEKGKKGAQISRYKGLGEMNPDQLWETTLDPNSRSLVQVKIEQEINAEETFSTLMGEVVEPRRNFIQENALNVSNLDI